MSVDRDTGAALRRIEAAEKQLFRLLEVAENIEHELSQARCALRGRAVERFKLPGGQSARRPVNVDASVLVLADAALCNGETDLD